MQRHRVLLAFGAAWLSALLLSWWVYQRTTAPQTRDVALAVAAAKDLPVGKGIEAADLKLITVDRQNLPKGAFLKVSDVVERAVTAPIAASELVLEGKLAAKGSGAGLTALIEPGMRAVSVQVNETSGVAGFIQPGTRVDVLFTRVFSNGDAATTTILQNVKVIAYGRQLEPGGRPDPREASRPTVATLLVTQEQGEKLALAVQRGRIQLALRNPLDEEIADDAPPIGSADLGIEEPEKPGPPQREIDSAAVARAAEAAIKAREKAEEAKRTVIRVYRGEKVTEETF